MASKKKIELIVPVLLNEIENIHHKVKLKLEFALRIRNDEEAVRRVLRELKELI